MNISQLLEAVKNPDITLSLSEKLVVGFSVALISMAVVFVILILIACVIKILQNDAQREVKNNKQISKDNVSIETQVVNNGQDIEELVSVITAAIASATGKSTNSIVVRKISRTNNSKTSWERMSNNTTIK